jgi:hypothetical protein
MYYVNGEKKNEGEGEGRVNGGRKVVKKQSIIAYNINKNNNKEEDSWLQRSQYQM